MRTRFLSLLALPVSIGVASAQCLTTTGGAAVTLVATLPPLAANDEGRSAPIAMGFNFPMAGAQSATYSHAVVDANGAIYLTNGGAAIGTADFGPQNGLDDLRGAAGDSPRVFPLWSDVEGIAANWSVRTDTSVAGRFRVVWRNVELVGSGGPTYSIGVNLFANGSVELGYSALPADAYGYAGISIGNGVGTGSEASSDLEPGASSGSLGLLFQEFDGLAQPGLTGKTVTIAPNGSGGYQSTTTCRAAEHRTTGVGCYDYQEANEALYQLFPNVAQSFSALPAGRSVQFTIAGLDSYLATNGGGTFVAPPATATTLTLSDDSQANVTPSSPFPHANGTSYAVISVCSNGFINMAPTGVNPNGTGGSVSGLLNAPAPSFRSQRDYNPAPAASGKVKFHEAAVGGQQTLFVTWDGVFLYNTTIPERFQFQLNLATGQVTVVWDTMTPTTTSTSRPLLVGLAQGASFDPGGIDLAVNLPLTTTADVEQRPLTLDASPAPITNPSTVVTYTIRNIPEALPGSGLRIAALFLSLGEIPGGLDLVGIGAPGCSAYLASLDLPISIPPGTSSTATGALTFTNVIPAGVFVYAQAIALFDPAFPLPNGQNAFGLLTSNAIRSNAAPF